MKTSVTHGCVSLKGNEMEYFTFGSGDTPMVILPGLSVRSVMQSAEGVASAYRLFSDRFKVYCFDRTKTITENITIEELSEDTACAMRTCEPGQGGNAAALSLRRVRRSQLCLSFCRPVFRFIVSP